MILSAPHLGEIFREDFSSKFDLYRNGGDLVGNPVVNGAYEGDGTSQSATYENFNWGHVRKYSIHVEVERFDSVSDQALVSSSTSSGPLLRLFSETTLQFFSDQSNSPFFNATVNVQEGDSGTFGVSFDSETQVAKLYWNGEYLAQKTAMPVSNTAENFLQLFSRITTNSSLDGKAKRVRIFNSVLSDADFEKLHDNTLFTWDQSFTDYWLMKDKIGTTNPFYSKNALNGEKAVLGDGAGNYAPTKVFGKDMYEFGGAHYLDCGPSSLADVGATELTVGGWIDLHRADFDGVFQVIVDTANATTSTNNGFVLYVDDRGGSATNSLNFAVHTSSGNSRGAISAQNAIQNGLQHVVGTYDSDNLAKLYVNGEDVTSATLGTATGDFVPSSTRDVLIGAYSALGQGGLDGGVGPLGIAKKAFSPMQVKDWFHRELNYLGS